MARRLHFFERREDQRQNARCWIPIYGVERRVLLTREPRQSLAGKGYGFIDKSILIVTEGLGPQRFHNEHTSSAGEMVVAFAQENGLATIVGTKTAGRLLSGSAFKAGFGYMLGLPVAAYLTWEGKLIEGKGVAPAVRVEMRPEHLFAGEDAQMKRALEIVRAI